MVSSLSAMPLSQFVHTDFPVSKREKWGFDSLFNSLILFVHLKIILWYCTYDWSAMKLSRTTFSIKTPSIMKLGLKTFSLKVFSIKTLSIKH